jgi:hypothetical protein
MLGTLLVATYCQAQSIQNVRASFANGKVTVVYDLTGAGQGQQFNLDLYASHDNFLKPLKQVSGDIGKNVSGGTTKRIEWDAAAELGAFSGQITFRIKGDPVPVAWAFKNPADGSSVRRGKSSTIQWEGGLKNQTVRLELLKDSKQVLAVGEMTNSGEYIWAVPKDLKTGEYTVKLSAGQESAQSAPFRVKAKVPLILKVTPLVVAGLVIILWPENPPPPPPTQDLPAAPGPG